METGVEQAALEKSVLLDDKRFSKSVFLDNRSSILWDERTQSSWTIEEILIYHLLRDFKLFIF